LIKWEKQPLAHPQAMINDVAPVLATVRNFASQYHAALIHAKMDPPDACNNLKTPYTTVAIIHSITGTVVPLGW
jgi:hypothetical protein